MTDHAQTHDSHSCTPYCASSPAFHAKSEVHFPHLCSARTSVDFPACGFFSASRMAEKCEQASRLFPIRQGPWLSSLCPKSDNTVVPWLLVIRRSLGPKAVTVLAMCA